MSRNHGLRVSILKTKAKQYTTSILTQIANQMLVFSDDKKKMTSTPFVDVPDDAYYATAVDWAYITGGTSAATYSLNDPCTRGQMVAFLYRYTAE